MERDRKVNPPEATEWVPVSTEVRIRQGLQSEDPELIRRTKDILDKAPEAPRAGPSKKRKVDFGPAFADKARGTELCQKLGTEIAEQVKKVAELTEAINTNIRMHNALTEVHRLDVEGFPKIAYLPEPEVMDAEDF